MKRKLDICEICEQNTAKYTCPACNLRTCCLACCQAHKTQYECTGIDSVLKSFAKKEFDNFHLLKDYRFLETLDQRVDHTENLYSKLNPKLRSRSYNLVSVAKKRGVRLEMLPVRFWRHQHNRSFVNRDTKGINWTLQLNVARRDFPSQISAFELKDFHQVLLHGVAETRSFNKIIRQELQDALQQPAKLEVPRSKQEDEEGEQQQQKQERSEQEEKNERETPNVHVIGDGNLCDEVKKSIKQTCFVGGAQMRIWVQNCAQCAKLCDQSRKPHKQQQQPSQSHQLNQKQEKCEQDLSRSRFVEISGDVPLITAFRGLTFLEFPSIFFTAE